MLNPLFLDDLRKHFESAKGNVRKLTNLKKRLQRIRIFDPACGSGNFLLIAYKEMRTIEHDINVELNTPLEPSIIPITNFRGIELEDFVAEIARLSLVIAEFQCNAKYMSETLALSVFCHYPRKIGLFAEMLYAWTGSKFAHKKELKSK